MIGDFLLPLLILIVLVIIGLTVWLVLTLTRSTPDKPRAGTKNRRSAPSSSDNILSVQRNQQGLWEVRVFNTPYQKLEEIPNPRLRAQVVDAIKIVAAFGRDYIVKQKKTTPERPTSPVEHTTPIPEHPTEEARLHRPSTPPQLMPQINLAEEIGDILEEMQKERPSLAKRSVRLQNAPDGGVRFVIDGQIYTSVGEIPDLEVQALIRDATREWERR